jgi:nucleoside-diphosphate-sugar epimerase
MQVLVMGGTQFNGIAVVNELIFQGHDVTIVNRGQSQALVPNAVTRLYADRTNHQQMREVLGGKVFDAIIDLSAYRLEDVQLMHELFKGKTGHYIFASSTLIYGRSDILPITEAHAVDRSEIQSDYAFGKLACEDFLFEKHRSEGFPVTVGVLSMVFGPNNIIKDREQRMFKRLLLGRKVLIPGDGTTMGQIGHVEDSARAFVMMMTKPITFGKRYNIVSDDYYTDDGYVDTFAKVTGTAPEKVYIPHDVMNDLWQGKVQLKMPDIQANINVRASANDLRMMALFNLTKLIQRSGFTIHPWNKNVIYSVSRLKDDIGWQPRYSFSGAVEHTYQWFVQNGLDESSEFDFEFEDQLLEMIENR